MAYNYAISMDNKELNSFINSIGTIVKVELYEEEETDYVKFIIRHTCNKKVSELECFVTYPDGAALFHLSKMRGVRYD